jgi:hypothetical protein
MPFMGPVVVGAATNIQIAGRGGVPMQANGIAGNVTVTSQSLGGFLCVAPKFDPGESPTFSTINFPKGDTRANGFDVSLGPGGSIGVMHEVTPGARTS